ncbi:MAG: LysR family transcriptional regulator [Myxococcota bacterium]
MQIQWDDLRYLEAIDRIGGVAGAARELGVSASTLYRRLTALERSVGETCLVRGSVQLTARGRELARIGKSMRERLTESEGAARAKHAAISGEVSLTTVEGFLPFLIAPIARLSERHPGLSVSLHLGDSGPSVQRREVDIAIGVMRRPPAGCIGKRVLKIRYGVFGTQGAVDAPSPRWIVTGPGLAHTAEAEWERAHATPVVARAPRLAMLEMVRAGLGIGLLPRAVAALDPALVEVGSWRARCSHLLRIAWILSHPESRKSARISAVVGALTEALERVES